MKRKALTVDEVPDSCSENNRIPAIMDLTQSLSGLLLALFMWGHMFFVSSILRELGKDVLFYYGAGTGDDIFFIREFEERCGRFIKVTEDGSSGRKGLVTDVFAEDAASGLITGDSAVISCGPVPMLRELSRKCERYNLSLEVSLENEMACGMGICQGCAVKVRNGEDFEYKLVCKDGPVFDAAEIIWDE